MFYVIFLCAVAGLVAADQWTKLWTVANFAAPAAPNLYSTADAAKPFLPGIVELTRVHNYGAAWSSFAGQKWLLIGFTSVMLVFVAVLVVKKVVRHPLGLSACGLVLAGGIGNLIDRVQAGYVVDMFHFEFWPSYPVFNVADICVVIGAVAGSVYYLWFYDKYDAKPKTAKKEETDGEADAPSES